MRVAIKVLKMFLKFLGSTDSFKVNGQRVNPGGKHDLETPVREKLEVIPKKLGNVENPDIA